MRWEDAINAYLGEQQAQGRINSDETMRSYRRTLNAHAADALQGPLAASRHEVKHTLSRWPNPNTRGWAHTILTSFYDWTCTEGYRLDNPARQVARPKMRKPTTVRLTRLEVAALIAACETQRERRVILLGVCVGARAGELIGFQGRHFERPGFVWISADIAKGKRERWVPVLPDAVSVVEEIRRTVRADHHVITTFQRGGGTVPAPPTVPISHPSLARIVKTVAERAGITTHVYPHLLRHAFGEHVARRAGLRVAQSVMGHANVQTTTVYTDQPGLDELAESVRGLRFGEPIAQRRARFADQMRAQRSSVTRSHSQTIDMGERVAVRFTRTVVR